MCGIVALWDRGSSDADRIASLTAAMRDELRYRGPDDAGLYVDRGAGLALGHRRLSILDLSPAGHQPMSSGSGRFVIVFNGEIYNHAELRRDLGNFAARGSSDTETMLAAFDAWGLEVALARFVGMFAFVLWDREDRVLHLVRDRLGIKPLVWGRASDGALLVASELGALRAHPDFDRTIDHGALTDYFAASCVPAPRTIHRSARKLRPGTLLTFRSPGATPEERTYWSACDRARSALASPLQGSDSELVDRVEAVVSDAVRLRLLADVPVGAFLSGGIDSSLVVALAQEHATGPIRTFSIGSAEAAYDESSFASEVARRLGTCHTTLELSECETLAIVPRVPAMYDEPFADSSQIPTYLVSQLARHEVTVALSGDGGDEVFGGYNRYLWGGRIAIAATLPAAWRSLAGAMLLRVPEDTWDRLARGKARLLGDKVHKVARALQASSADAIHASLRTHWPISPVRDPHPSPYAEIEPSRSIAETMMLRDMVEYLPDDILTKVDRASMRVSLEARVPLLDHRVVELAQRLPLRLKIRSRRGKWVLREILARRLPGALFDRAKTGFSIPIGQWLRGPLRSWASDLLDERTLSDAGLDAPLVLSRWRDHQARRAEHGLALWDVLSFRAWHEHLAPASARVLSLSAVAT